MANDITLRVVINAITTGLQNGVNEVENRIRSFATSAQTLLAGLGFGALARDIFQTNVQFDSLGNQLNNLFGSAEAGADAFRSAMNWAKATPFELKDITQAFVTLKNMGIEPTDTMMSDLTNTASKMGRGAQSLTTLTMQLGQAWTKGKLQAQDMNIMMEGGAPIMEALQNVTKKTSGEIYKMAENGELGRESISALITELGRLADGSNAKAMGTLAGKISLLSDAWHTYEDTLLQDKSEGFIKTIVMNWSAWLDYFSDKIDATKNKLNDLEALNQKIATKKEKISTMQGEGMVGSIIDNLTGQDVNLEKNRLDQLVKQRDQMTKAIVDDNNAERSRKDATAATTKLKAEEAAKAKELAEHAEEVEKWTKKYGDNQHRMTMELEAAKKALGKDFTPEIEQGIRAKFAGPKGAANVDAGKASREAERQAKEQARQLKEAEDLEFQILTEQERNRKQLAEESLSAQQSESLDAIALKEQASQQDLQLGNITQEEHLSNLRQFAAEQLAIEKKLLDDKRKLLAGDELALAQNLHAKEAIERQYKARTRQLDKQAELEKKNSAKAMFAPFSHAVDQMVNGVLTGQQKLGAAIKKGLANILLSYISTMAKERAIDVAMFAWKKARWALEIMGFIGKEAVLTGTKVQSETVQTGAQLAGDAIRTQSTIASAATKKTVTEASAKSGIFTTALETASNAYKSAAAIPYVGWVLGPIAAVAAFAAVMAFGGKVGSAKGGEWNVGGDDSPYLLHKNESVLPAHVAEDFRTVVGMVHGQTVGVPSSASDVGFGSRAAAQIFAGQVAARQNAAAGQHVGKVRNEVHVSTISAKEFFSDHGETIVKTLSKQQRNFKGVKK